MKLKTSFILDHVNHIWYNIFGYLIDMRIYNTRLYVTQTWSLGMTNRYTLSNENCKQRGKWHTMFEVFAKVNKENLCAQSIAIQVKANINFLLDIDIENKDWSINICDDHISIIQHASVLRYTNKVHLHISLRKINKKKSNVS